MTKNEAYHHGLFDGYHAKKPRKLILSPHSLAYRKGYVRGVNQKANELIREVTK